VELRVIAGGDPGMQSAARIGQPDPAGAVPELARVLRPGGRLYIYDFGFVPFDAAAETDRVRNLFTTRPVRKTTIRTGVLWPRRCVRQVLTA
jgi:SAM-dependent methyltransferase